MAVAVPVVIPAVARMQPGDHYCGIVRTNDDHRTVVVDFVRLGVARNERILYLLDTTTREQLCTMLRGAGLQVDDLIANGQLVLRSAREAYMPRGYFDPEAMIASLEKDIDKALAEGFAALRATGEMTWALHDAPGAERLVEYEARVNALFGERRCYGLCQYDRRKFGSDVLLDVLHAHPKVLHGKDALDNSKMYFVPPESLFEQDRHAATLDLWLKNLGQKRIA